jgi:hypothetical protein
MLMHLSVENRFFIESLKETLHIMYSKHLLSYNKISVVYFITHTFLPMNIPDMSIHGYYSAEMQKSI